MSSPSPAKEEAAASAPVGAAATSSTENDATIAMAFQAVEKLVTIFGFDPILAETAVNEVGPDVTTAYNWILGELFCFLLSIRNRNVIMASSEHDLTLGVFCCTSILK
jgi:hypothetical protein